ncbi:MAG: hypothetical protein LBN07_04880 [Christensenellaceae bacterium]|jgi:hypothetical protein|nr:hypothetical protein [Christensenellaceae bacterium]
MKVFVTVLCSVLALFFGVASIYIFYPDGRVWLDDKFGVERITVSDGKDGVNGQDGLTPYVGENNNWWIGETDTGVLSGHVNESFNLIREDNFSNIYSALNYSELGIYRDVSSGLTLVSGCARVPGSNTVYVGGGSALFEYTPDMKLTNAFSGWLSAYVVDGGGSVKQQGVVRVFVNVDIGVIQVIWYGASFSLAQGQYFVITGSYVLS